MTLGELRALLRGSILNDRTDRLAGSSDYLWDDATLTTYINEAQRRLAVKGLVLRDGSTDAVTLLTLLEGRSEYILHSSVLAVISTRITTANSDLKRVGHAFLNAYTPPTDNWIDPATLSNLLPGSPLAFSTDEELKPDTDGTLNLVTLRVYPVPGAAAAGTQLRLRVVRKPLVAMAVDSDVPEVPDDHHIEMLDYAAYLALRIVDDDAGAPKRAAEFLQMFEANVLEARKSAMRKLFAPMGWGFGRSGFSWEH